MRKKRVVVITGATGRIGGELSMRFGRDGCRIGILFNKNRDGAGAMAEKLKQTGAEAIPLPIDVRSPQTLKAASSAVMKRWSRVDILICAAGIRHDSILLRTSEADWEETMAVNLKGVWNTLRAFGKELSASGTGQALVIGSAAGIHGRPGQASYTASKAGLIGLVRSAAREWARDPIRVNLVFPGFHPGGIAEGLTQKEKTTIMESNLLKRSPSIPDVAEMIFQISKISSASGQIFNLDSRIF